ncbi:methyltransferase domain-containing protein [Xylophilus sp. Kf1]|nr:methyltransferase domain-containing protein [Xylophilus sp. Kf1]
MSYYDNFNPTLLELVSPTALRICEVGCGSGGLARAVKSRNPEVFYAGVELMEEPLSRAAEILDCALLRNLDSISRWDDDIELATHLPKNSFDHVIFGDVLEHLYSPKISLEQAITRLKIGGSVLACIPNVQHWSVFAQLIKGTWPQQDSGIFDRTHIRWFTLADMLLLFEEVGLEVVTVVPRIFDQERGLDIMEYLEPLAAHLGVDEQMLVQRGLPLQYVIQARRN